MYSERRTAICGYPRSFNHYMSFYGYLLINYIEKEAINIHIVNYNGKYVIE